MAGKSFIEKQNNTAKSNLDKTELTVKKITVNNYFDAHWHDYFEIKLILSGNGTVFINGEEHTFKKGSLYLIMPANIHAFVPENEVELYNVTIRESILFDESIIMKLSGFSKLFFQLSEEDFDYIYYILELLNRENKKKLDFKDQIIKNLLECLLLTLIRKSGNNYYSSDNSLTAIQMVVSYLKIHFRDDVTVEKVATLSGFNEGYFSTLFRKNTGTTFVKYLNNLRLEYSKTLLLSNKFSIGEICSLSGFKSYSNFLKAFKNKYGALPKEYLNADIKG